jgi:hypothetical protein
LIIHCLYPNKFLILGILLISTEIINDPNIDVEESGDMPWDKPGAKQPEDYTFAEYEELTAEQQIAFFESFVIPVNIVLNHIRQPVACQRMYCLSKHVAAYESAHTSIAFVERMNVTEQVMKQSRSYYYL